MLSKLKWIINVMHILFQLMPIMSSLPHQLLHIFTHQRPLRSLLRMMHWSLRIYFLQRRSIHLHSSSTYSQTRLISIPHPDVSLAINDRLFVKIFQKQHGGRYLFSIHDILTHFCDEITILFLHTMRADLVILFIWYFLLFLRLLWFDMLGHHQL